MDVLSFAVEMRENSVFVREWFERHPKVTKVSVAAKAGCHASELSLFCHRIDRLSAEKQQAVWAGLKPLLVGPTAVEEKGDVDDSDSTLLQLVGKAKRATVKLPNGVSIELEF
jgi:hypothetical protein